MNKESETTKHRRKRLKDKSEFDFYYHIKPLSYVDEILKNGIHALKQKIYVITDYDVIVGDQNIIEWIARNLMFIDEYALFKISVDGISGKMTTEETDLLTSRFHRIVHQDKITPEHIVLVEKVTLKPAAEALTDQLKSFGWPDEIITDLATSEKNLMEVQKKVKTEGVDPDKVKQFLKWLHK